jgi:hypothetical protein
MRSRGSKLRILIASTALRADRVAERFASLDGNGDGVLSKDELAAGMSEPHARGAHGRMHERAHEPKGGARR